LSPNFDETQLSVLNKGAEFLWV